MKINLVRNSAWIGYPKFSDFLKTLEDDRLSKYDFNMVNEYDINNKNEKYLLIYPFQGHTSHKIKNGDELFSEIMLKRIQEGFDVKIFFCTEAECEHEDAVDVVYEYITSRGIQPKNVYLISGNSKIESLNLLGMNTIENFNPIIHRVANTMKGHGELDNLYGYRKYIFQCYNNVMKSHRIATLYLLKQKNLLPHTDWSALRTDDLKNLVDDGLHEMYNIFTRDRILLMKENYYQILNDGNSKYSEYEDETMRNPNAEGEPDHNMTYPANPHKNAYINIITESQFVLRNTIHITEKSLIPFEFYQLPIFVATQGHVAKLKKLYGFDVFDDVINHSYDEIENPEERLNAIILELIRLKNSERYIKNFFKKSKDRFDKNRKIIEKIPQVHPYDVIFKEFLK